MKFSQEIVDQKLEQVPENIREAVISDTVIEALSGIAKKYSLHIDQIGILEEEALYIILGLETPDQFLKSLSERIAIPQSTAANIARDVNTDILLPIRANLQKEAQAETVQNQTAPEENISRADILSEIENPTPTIHPISSADQTIAGPALQREITSADQKPQETGESVAQDFISGKLTETVSLPSKKAVTTPEKLNEKPPAKPVQKTDPYREPVA